MPWQLTTPVQVGELDAAAYDQVRITRLFLDSVRGAIDVHIEYGRTVDGSWVAGYAPRDMDTVFRLEGQTYLDLVNTHTPNPGEVTYEAVKRAMYEWLAANGHIAVGAIV